MSFGMIFMPGKNSDLGVKHLPVILDLAFGLERRRECRFHEVLRYQLPIGVFFLGFNMF